MHSQKCARCGHSTAVFFQADEGSAQSSLQLYFVCEYYECICSSSFSPVLFNPHPCIIATFTLLRRWMQIQMDWVTTCTSRWYIQVNGFGSWMALRVIIVLCLSSHSLPNAIHMYNTFNYSPLCDTAICHSSIQSQLLSAFCILF